MSIDLPGLGKDVSYASMRFRRWPHLAAKQGLHHWLWRQVDKAMQGVSPNADTALIWARTYMLYGLGQWLQGVPGCLFLDPASQRNREVLHEVLTTTPEGKPLRLAYAGMLYNAGKVGSFSEIAKAHTERLGLTDTQCVEYADHLRALLQEASRRFADEGENEWYGLAQLAIASIIPFPNQANYDQYALRTLGALRNALDTLPAGAHPKSHGARRRQLALWLAGEAGLQIPNSGWFGTSFRAKSAPITSWDDVYWP